MSEDYFEPSFPTVDDEFDYDYELSYGSPLEDDDVPLNLEIPSGPHLKKSNGYVSTICSRLKLSLAYHHHVPASLLACIVGNHASSLG